MPNNDENPSLDLIRIEWVLNSTIHVLSDLISG